MAKPKARTQNQHYIPQMCLKPFVGTSPANMLWVYDTDLRHWRPSTTANAGAQTNYYSVKNDDGSYADQVDHWLTDMEGKAAGPYAKLLAGQVPADQDKMNLAVFFAALHCRSPGFVRSYAHMLAQSTQALSNFMTSSREVFDEQLDRYEAATGKIEKSRDELWEFQTDPSRYYLSVSEKAGLRALRVTDALAPILFDRNWTLMVPSAGYFITSDNPVYRFVPPDDQHRFYGDGGFANPRAEITVPLSPSLALLISLHGEHGQVFDLPKQFVQQANMQRAFAAERFLYSRERDATIAALGDEFADHKQRMLVGDGGKAEIVITR